MIDLLRCNRFTGEVLSILWGEKTFWRRRHRVAFKVSEWINTHKWCKIISKAAWLGSWRVSCICMNHDHLIQLPPNDHNFVISGRIFITLSQSRNFLAFPRIRWGWCYHGVAGKAINVCDGFPRYCLWYHKVWRAQSCTIHGSLAGRRQVYIPFRVLLISFSKRHQA